MSRAGAVDILRGVSLDVKAGETVAIVGPSGSGKTSLMMIMAGLERATSGSVIVAGHDFTALDEDELALGQGAGDRHRFPIVPSRANDDSAGKRGASAGIRR